MIAFPVSNKEKTQWYHWAPISSKAALYSPRCAARMH